MRAFPAALLLASLSPAATNLKSLDIAAIDKTCKPCDDFYQYAIGAWHAANPIPASQTRWGKRWAAADGNREVLRGIIEPLTSTAAKSPAQKNIGAFYTSCMDTAAIDKAGATPIQPLLASFRSLTTVPSVSAAIAQMNGLGLDTLFATTPVPYTEDPDQVVAGIRPGSQGLPDRDYYLKDDPKSKATREQYQAYIQKLFMLAGARQPEAIAAAATVLRIETSLARSQMSRVEYRDPQKTNNHLQAAQLEELVPHLDWDHYFRAIGAPASNLVRLSDLGWMKEAERQLTATTPADWGVYLSWRLLRGSARNLSAPFRKAAFDFEDAYMAGQKVDDPRWKQCVDSADRMLGNDLGRAYVEKVFPPDAKAKMQDMVKNLRAALGQGIQALEWMTPATKEKALAKLATFDPKVGYPDRWYPYTGPPMSKTDFYANVRNAAAFLRLDASAQIGKPVDRNRWGMTTPTSNAYYNSLKNEIVFPAGILVPPMFNLAADDAVNYGAIGVVIGHEISHGYDDSGSQYDAEGKLKNWWTQEDRKSFLERAQCVVNQFDNYYIDGPASDPIHHNGKLVLGESIGDLAGARIAFAAYMKSIEGKPNTPDKDGFTHEQRFFISWGQSRGDSTRIETQRLMVVTDPHPVAKFRVIGPLSNMEEFHKAFACKRGDPMWRPPENRCRVW